MILKLNKGDTKEGQKGLFLHQLKEKVIEVNEAEVEEARKKLNNVCYGDSEENMEEDSGEEEEDKETKSLAEEHLENGDDEDSEEKEIQNIPQRG